MRDFVPKFWPFFAIFSPFLFGSVSANRNAEIIGWMIGVTVGPALAILICLVAGGCIAYHLCIKQRIKENQADSGGAYYGGRFAAYPQPTKQNFSVLGAGYAPPPPPPAATRAMAPPPAPPAATRGIPPPAYLGSSV